MKHTWTVCRISLVDEVPLNAWLVVASDQYRRLCYTRDLRSVSCRIQVCVLKHVSCDSLDEMVTIGVIWGIPDSDELVICMVKRGWSMSGQAPLMRQVSCLWWNVLRCGSPKTEQMSGGERLSDTLSDGYCRRLTRKTMKKGENSENTKKLQIREHILLWNAW